MEKEKPEWLQALEAQSWQAELIASGLAIYGSLSMGIYIDNFAEWAVLRFDDRILDILYFLLWYIYIAHAVLVISFITHLVLRILWAGILGLSSVYPKGINMETKAYSDHYKEKLKEEFPDLSQYSLDLDKLCSLIFSVLCALVIVLVSFSFWLFIYILVSELLLQILPVSIVSYIGYGLAVFIFLFSILSGLLIQKKFNDNKFAKKYAYKFNRLFGKIFYFSGYKAFSYISHTIRTNVTSKLFFVGMFAIFIISMAVALPKFEKVVPYYKSDIFIDLQANESQVSKANYLDALQSNYILQPTIQSEIINDSYIKLYIPKFKREQAIITNLCGDFEWNDDLSAQKNRELRNTFNIKCANKYYKMSLNNVPLKNIDFQYRRNLYNNREGYQVFISVDTIPSGNHILQIESKYKVDDQNYIRSIPFYKTK